MKYLLITIVSLLLASIVILFERVLWIPQTKSLISLIISISFSSAVFPRIINKLFKFNITIYQSLMLFLFLHLAGFLGLFSVRFTEGSFTLFFIFSLIIFSFLICSLLMQKLISSYDIKKNTILFNATLNISPFLISFLSLILSIVLVFNILTPTPPLIPFWKSIQSGNINVVKQHIRAGTSANKSEGIGETPLHWAAFENRLEIGEILIRNGAHVNGRGMFSKQPVLNRAIISMHYKFVELLIKNGADVNIQKGVLNPNTQNISHYLYPLDLAISLREENNYTKKTQLKLERIISLLRKNGGKSAIENSIYRAAQHGNIKSVELHLERGLKINEKTKHGLTALHYASRARGIAIPKLLIAKGANVNAIDNRGFTPLHIAAAYGRTKVVEQLIAEGSMVNVKDNYGRSPLTSAMIFNNDKAADLLKNHGANSGAKDTIQIAALVGDIDSVKEHLDTGVDVNSKDSRGRTALIQSAYSGRKKIAELLIKKGADVNSETNQGSTALHVSSSRGHKEIAELLIENGIDVNAQDSTPKSPGNTPLDIIIKKRKRHHLGFPRSQIEDLLRKHGAKTAEELKAESK